MKALRLPTNKLAYLMMAFFLCAFIPTGQSQQSSLLEEKEGLLVVEAEHFVGQTVNTIRKWYVLDGQEKALPQPDSDPSHANTASGSSYLEILPDTRKNHDEKLIAGENFSNTAGEIALLHYLVYFNTPGKYYVWVRAYSTGSEDNGIHVGLDGEWPTSGQRMQWCEGKNQWTWASKQRTKEIHCGVPELIYLEIPSAGWHEISFSMREDGFEFDKWIMTQTYEMPEGAGPPESPAKF